MEMSGRREFIIGGGALFAAAVCVAIVTAAMSAFAWDNPSAQADAAYTWGGASPTESNINAPTVQFKLYRGTANILPLRRDLSASPRLRVI